MKGSWNLTCRLRADASFDLDAHLIASSAVRTYMFHDYEIGPGRARGIETFDIEGQLRFSLFSLSGLVNFAYCLAPGLQNTETSDPPSRRIVFVAVATHVLQLTPPAMAREVKEANGRNWISRTQPLPELEARGEHRFKSVKLLFGANEGILHSARRKVKGHCSLTEGPCCRCPDQRNLSSCMTT